jgi:ABC-type lipoprotein release transport system permease subunit
MILKLIWRNLWRNSRRTWITTASISFSVFLAIAMQSFQRGVFTNLVNNIVGFYSGYIQIHKSGYWDEKVLDHCFDEADSLYTTLSEIPGMKSAAPRLETFILASIETTTKGCLLTGIDPEKEDALTGIRKRLIAGEYLERIDTAVLLAEGLAERLGVSLNDTIVLFGQGFQGTLAAGKYPVKGILHLAAPSLNDNMVFMPLNAARYLLNAESKLTSLCINIENTGTMNNLRDEIAARLDTTYETMTWEEMMPDIAGHIKADSATNRIYTGILYFIISFGFFGTILMMAAERTYEFGMLIAIGMKKMKLGLILIGETFVITIFGICIGMFISLPFVLYFQRHPIRFGGTTAKAYEQFGFEPVFPTMLHPPIFFTQAVIVFFMALIIGLYPMWYVHRLDPVTSMKH